MGERFIPGCDTCNYYRVFIEKGEEVIRGEAEVVDPADFMVKFLHINTEHSTHMFESHPPDEFDKIVEAAESDIDLDEEYQRLWDIVMPVVRQVADIYNATGKVPNELLDSVMAEYVLFMEPKDSDSNREWGGAREHLDAHNLFRARLGMTPLRMKPQQP